MKNAGFAFVGSVLAVYEDGRLVVDTPDGLVTSDVVGDRGEKLLYSYESAEFILTAADILPDGRLVTASLGGVVHLWDIGDPDVDPTGVEPVELSRRDEDSFQLAALADGRVAFSVGSGTIMVVDPENPAADPIGFPGHDLLVSGIVGLPDGRVASAGARTLQIWDPDRLPERIVPGGGPSGIDEPDVVFAGHPTGEPIWSLARLADGRVVSGSGDGTVRGVEARRADRRGRRRRRVRRPPGRRRRRRRHRRYRRPGRRPDRLGLRRRDDLRLEPGRSGWSSGGDRSHGSAERLDRTGWPTDPHLGQRHPHPTTRTTSRRSR